MSENEREQLQTIIKKGSDWRERERAQTIVMLSEGQPVFAVAEKQGVMPEAVRERRRKWLKSGLWTSQSTGSAPFVVPPAN